MDQLTIDKVIRLTDKRRNLKNIQETIHRCTIKENSIILTQSSLKIPKEIKELTVDFIQKQLKIDIHDLTTQLDRL